MNNTALIYILVSILLSGCVTVKLDGGGKGSRAEGVTYRAPGNGFAEETRASVDAAWKNPKNGNVISFLSDCKDPSDPPLDQIVQGIVSGLSDLKTESSETVTVQGREGRRVVAFGKVDGVPSGIELLVFKRNMCIYMLSYVGVKKAFADNRADFSRFVEGFQAP
ncbi:MAG: hypothetical protein KF799_15685 [Bdellovibrionales bacterium]|nr:hypothetical protein [Bdellovibrionales bacterium]